MKKEKKSSTGNIFDVIIAIMNLFDVVKNNKDENKNKNNNDKKQFDNFIFQLKKHYDKNPKETMDELNIIINKTDNCFNSNIINIVFFIISIIIFLITTNSSKGSSYVFSDFIAFMMFYIVFYIGVLFGLRDSETGIYISSICIVISLYGYMEVGNLLQFDNIIYGSLIKAFSIITIIITTIIFIITCIYNKNDKYKINSTNYVKILFLYILPIFLLRLMIMFINMI